MKLLIVTQAVDENDPILGFFVRWIAEFSKHVEHIEVICLREGKYLLPRNVRVHVLGKPRLAHYVWLVYSLRKSYTHVFAHMSPEFFIAGAPVWLMWGKKTALWYNHAQRSLRLRLAAHLVDVVFHTSPYAASARFAHAKKMPAGIDTELFKPQSVPKDLMGLYFQGRVSYPKRVSEICKAVKVLREKKIPVTLTVVGPADPRYKALLIVGFSDLIDSKAIIFLGSAENFNTPVLYSAARVSINLTAAGNYDKTVLESMACETPVIVSSPAFADIIPQEWIVPEHDTTVLAEKITRMLALPEGKYHELVTSLRAAVVEKHSLPMLAQELFSALASL